jgi:hypothetical protein
MAVVISPYQFRGMDLIGWFPSVVTVRVSFPFDKVLELP